MSFKTFYFCLKFGILSAEGLHLALQLCVLLLNCHQLFIEFYGAFSSGKTTTALDIIANYQRLEEARDVLYIDAENTLDAEWAKKLGVDVDKLVILQPKEQSAEQLFDIIIKAVSTGEVGLWVLDSIGVLQSDLEMSKGIGEATYGGISKPQVCSLKECSLILPSTKL